MTLLRGLICLLLMTSFVSRAQVNIVTAIEPPASFYNDDGELDGYFVKLVQALQERVGHPHSIEVNPWARLIYRAEQQEKMLVFPLVRTPEREDHFYWLMPLSRNVHGIYQLTPPKGVFQSLSALNKDKLWIGVERGDFREALLLNHGAVNIVSYTHWEQAVEALARGRVDRLFFSPAGIQTYCARLSLHCDNVYPVYRHDMLTSYIAMPKAGVDEATYQRWQAAIDEYRTSEDFQVLIERWEQRFDKLSPVSTHFDKGVIHLWSAENDSESPRQIPVDDAVQ